MSVAKVLDRLLRNTGLSVVGSVFSRVSSSIFFIIVSRSYGVELSGVFSIALGYFYLGSRFSFWGLDHLLTRQVAREPSHLTKYLGNFVVLRVVFASLTLLGVYGLIAQADYGDQARAVISIVALSIWFESIGNILQATFIAGEELGVIALISIISGGSKMLLALLLRNNGVRLLSVVFTLSNLLSMLLSLYFVVRRTRILPIRIDLQFCLQQLRVALPFFFIASLFILDNRVDVLLLSALTTEYDVGLYSAAIAIVTALSIVPQAFRTSLYPILARYQATSGEATRRLHSGATKYLFIFALPATVGVILLADDVIDIVYGAAFLPSTRLLQVAMLSFFAYCLTVVNSRMLIVNDQQIKLSGYLLTSTIVTIVVNFVFVPWVGVIGAAIAKVASSVVLQFLNYRAVRKLVGSSATWHYLWRSAVACVLMGVCVQILEPAGMWAQIALGSITYLVAFLVLGGLTDQEKAMWRDLARQRVLGSRLHERM